MEECLLGVKGGLVFGGEVLELAEGSGTMMEFFSGDRRLPESDRVILDFDLVDFPLEDETAVGAGEVLYVFPIAAALAGGRPPSLSNVNDSCDEATADIFGARPDGGAEI